MDYPIDQLLSLPAADKLAIVEALWDNLSELQEPIELPPEQWMEVDRRAAELRSNPSIGISREELWQRVDERNG